MKVAKTAVCAVVLLLAVVPQLGAQPFKWWQDEKSKAQLGLTADQVTRIEEIFQTAAVRMRPNYEELSRQEKAFSALLEKPETAEADVMRLADQVESLRADLGKARTLMLFRFNRVLSPEQRVKLKEMHDRRERGRSKPPGDRR